MKSFTYRLIPDQGGPRDWVFAKLKYQSEDLELILWDAVRPGRLCFGLQWGRSRSWLCFALGDDFLVDRGILATSFRRCVRVDGGVITDSWPRGIRPISSNH